MMRFSRTLLSGLVLSAVLTGNALATTEPQPATAEEKGPDSAVTVTPPASAPEAAAEAGDSALPPNPEEQAVEPQTADPATSTSPTDPAAASTEPLPATGTEMPASSEPATAEPMPQEPADPATAEAPVEVFQLKPEILRLIAEKQSLSDKDREALTAFYESRGDDLLWISEGSFNARAEAVMAEIRRADDWGLEASAFELPPAPGSSEPADVTATELQLSLAVLKYANHARGGRMDPKQLSNYIDREPPLLPPSDVLAGAASAESVDGWLRGLHPQHPQFEKLRQAYLDLKRGVLPVETAEDDVAPKGRAAKKKSAKQDPQQTTMRKLLHNMEQWRWMPEDLGRYYVWANLPEFTLRVMKDGEAVFTERLIVGKRDTQTPIFSDEMETIVVHPFWGVPDSIKIKEILPSLARGGRVLAKNNLRIQYRGRDIDPYSVDWTRTDIRRFHVYQPPGGNNVLGVVKFLFPNEHQVYMHDTPTKNLFTASQRMFSHGCMRVRNPLRFAEVLLSADKGWDEGRVAALVRNGPRNNHINLDTKVPVHITYFTAWVDDDGKLNTRSDVYGHEQRIQMGLEGKAHLIAKRKQDLGAARAEVLGRLAESSPTWSPASSSRQPDWVRRVFGNN